MSILKINDIKCLSCHIIGFNPFSKKTFVDKLNEKIFNVIDLDIINQEILKKPELDKMYQQYQKLKDDKNDKFKEVDKKMSSFWEQNFKDTIDAFGFKGTWKFFGKHWRFGLDEYRGAFSKTYFLNRLRKLIPTLEMDDIIPARCGIRAMALGPEGEMLDDFKIEKHGNAMHVINSPSPAATASLAYGNEIALMATEYFNLK